MWPSASHDWDTAAILYTDHVFIYLLTIIVYIILLFHIIDLKQSNRLHNLKLLKNDVTIFRTSTQLLGVLLK